MQGGFVEPVAPLSLPCGALPIPVGFRGKPFSPVCSGKFRRKPEPVPRADPYLYSLILNYITIITTTSIITIIITLY